MRTQQLKDTLDAIITELDEVEEIVRRASAWMFAVWLAFVVVVIAVGITLWVLTG